MPFFCNFADIFNVTSPICCILLFWLKYMKKIQSHRHNVIGKGRSILIAFQVIVVFFFSLTLHQNSVRRSFLKVRCSVESERSVNFSHSDALKPVGLSAPRSGLSLVHDDFITSYHAVGCADLSNLKFPYLLPKSHSFVWLISENPLNFVKLQAHTGVITFLKF